MKNYLTGTREGNARKERKERTHTNTPGPERANPEKARERKVAEADGNGPRPEEGGGRTEAPEPTYQSET